MLFPCRSPFSSSPCSSLRIKYQVYNVVPGSGLVCAPLPLGALSFPLRVQTPRPSFSFSSMPRVCTRWSLCLECPPPFACVTPSSSHGPHTWPGLVAIARCDSASNLSSPFIPILFVVSQCLYLPLDWKCQFSCFTRRYVPSVQHSSAEHEDSSYH